MTIPAIDLALMRSHPQMSDVYLVIQQPQRFTEAPYFAQREWVDYDWYCRVNGDQTAEIAGSISVINGGPAATLLDGMTVLIGSAYGEWDKLAVRLRTDQNVGPGTTTLYIATSSDVRGRVRDGDYIVVLDEFRLWQRFGRIELVAEVINWYKDHDITWANLGANDIARRLAMVPPCPVMGPHAVKFVDPSEGDGHSSQFYFDWSDSYAMAVGETISSWNSWGEKNHTGGTWTYNANATPRWQTTEFISGLRGFRVVLEVDDGNGNAKTLPYRRGVRYVFTLRRPGQTQEYDPANAEPITDFAVNGPIQGSFEAGHWRTSITVFGEAASKYNIMPEALVILFTDDHYMADDPYLAPRGLRNVSIGPIYDRENILLVGRIIGSSIQVDSETEDVTFEVLSPGAEAAMYHDYPIVIQDDVNADEWIDTPSLTPDRAVWYYLCWHTTLPHTCDLYLPGDTHPIFAQDFLEGTIQDTVNGFLRDRIMGRMLCDKYGRIHCEVNAQDQPYGSIETLWVLEDGDWVDNLRVRQALQAKVKSAEAGGLIYTPATGVIVPKLSRAPGQFDKYRGTPRASNSLAINTQAELNIISGRYLERLNYEYDSGINLAGFWPYLDIAPQQAIHVQKALHRGDIDGRFLPRNITFSPRHDSGCIFTDVDVEQEMDDGIPGVTIDIPEELPDIPPPPDGGPPPGWDPPGKGYNDTGRRILATNVGVVVTDEIGATYPHWYKVTNGLPLGTERCWMLRRDPWHWWTTTDEKTMWGVFGPSARGDRAPWLYKMENFPYGTWILKYTAVGDRPTVADLDGSIEIEDRWYMLRFNKTWGVAGGNLYVHRSVNGGDDGFPQLNDLGEIGQYPEWPTLRHKLALAQHSGAQVQHVAGSSLHSTKNGAWTINEWATFTSDSDYPVRSNSLIAPYINAGWDDSYLINIRSYVDVYDTDGALTTSIDRGANWTVIDPPSKAYAASTYGYALGCLVAMGTNGVVYTTIDNGTTWVPWLDTLLAGMWAISMCTKFAANGLPENILAFYNTLPERGAYLLSASGKINKTGDLLTIAPLLTSVVGIERDTTGLA